MPQAWKSPLSAELLAASEVPLLQIAACRAGDKFYFLEQRPADNGRRCIVEHGPDGVFRDVLGPEFDAHTSVHGYGGGAFAQQYRGLLVFADRKTQGVFALDPTTGTASEIVPGDATTAFADFDAADDHQRWILAVREEQAKPQNRDSIVAIDLHTHNVHTVVSGADFYAHPRLCAYNGVSRICWVEWNHPDMPWTGSRLMVADWQSGHVEQICCLAGQTGRESVAQPHWNHHNGTLIFASDRTGFWQLYVYDGRKVEWLQLDGLAGGNFAYPEWKLGSVVALWTHNAVTRLVSIELSSKTYTLHEAQLDAKLPSIQRIAADRVAFIASTPLQASSLYVMDAQGMTAIRKSASYEIDPRYLSRSVPVTFTTPAGVSTTRHEAYAMFNAPLNPQYETHERPPLIVMMHGGPTDHVGVGLSLSKQFWTTRGYAVASINYAGSSGYSREYRNRLDGAWGVVEVDDAVACVRDLAERGEIDARRVGIVGSSAGGYSVLQALCNFPEVWAGGVSLYGIGDVKALVEETHKFESRYADGLLFGAHAGEDQGKIIHNRSPVHHAEKIKAAVLLLQGTEDEVVPPQQARDMAQVMQQHGRECRLVFLEGEGHGFVRAENVQRAYEEQETWWQRTLCGQHGV